MYRNAKKMEAACLALNSLFKTFSWGIKLAIRFFAGGSCDVVLVVWRFRLRYYILVTTVKTIRSIDRPTEHVKYHGRQLVKLHELWMSTE